MLESPRKSQGSPGPGFEAQLGSKGLEQARKGAEYLTVSPLEFMVSFDSFLPFALPHRPASAMTGLDVALICGGANSAPKLHDLV